MENRASILFLFLDGFGLAAAGPNNPLSIAPMRNIRRLCGGALVDTTGINRPELLLKPIDACLGVPGIPQSATGQTALFTGRNAAKELGYHLPAFPTAPLIRIIEQDSIFKRVKALGLPSTFANAYSGRYFRMMDEGKRTHSVTTHAVLAAGLPLRTMDDLRKGKAVYFDVTNRSVRERGEDIEEIAPALAGKRLAAIAAEHALTVFECFVPDLVGHKCEIEKAIPLIELLDEFIGSIADARSRETTVVITSDHGNIEDLSTSSHTVNPVPLLAIGPAAGRFASVNAIDEVAGAILNTLE
jgi:hypothetical protein